MLPTSNKEEVVVVLRLTGKPVCMASKRRRAGAKGKIPMEKVSTDTYSTWKNLHAIATELRCLMSRRAAEDYLTDGLGSLVTYKQELGLLRGLDGTWPTSFSDPVLRDAREVTLTILAVRNQVKNAIVDPLLEINTGACCTKALHSYSRALRHLLSVEASATQEMTALEKETPPSAEKESHSLKIAKYVHYLDWLKYVLSCLHRARKTVLGKLEDYHKGSLPPKLTHLQPQHDAPKQIEGVCASCDEPTVISAKDGDVYLKGEVAPHEICIGFGNRLLERLNATRVVSKAKDLLCVASDVDIASVESFLKSTTKEGEDVEEWLTTSLLAFERMRSTDDVLVLPPSPVDLKIHCPVCSKPALLSVQGVVRGIAPNENDHEKCDAPNLLEKLKLSLTRVKIPKRCKILKKSIPSSAELSEHDRTLVLNAMILHPGKQFRTIAQIVCAEDLNTDKKLGRDHVAEVATYLRSNQHSDLEKAAYQSRSAHAKENTHQVPVTTPQPRRRKESGGGGRGSRTQGITPPSPFTAFIRVLN